MPRMKSLIQQFNWKILFIRILINAAVLALTVLIIPDIYFVNRSFGTILITSLGLGILNALVKPVMLLLTGQFIFATFGLLLILVNAFVLYLLEWLFPNHFAVDSLVWALIGGTVISLLSNALENLMGLTPPIVPEENVELRKRIEAEQQASLVNLVAKPQTMLPNDAETQVVSELTAAQAALAAIQEVAPTEVATPKAENGSQESLASSHGISEPDVPQEPGEPAESQDEIVDKDQQGGVA